MILASPVIFYQLWRFTAPGLYQHEKKVLLPFVFISTCFFLCGICFAYFIVFPPAFDFLVGYTTEYLDPMPAVAEYFSLALRLLVAFGVVFELPVLMVFLAKIGMVNVSFLNRHRKYAVLINFVIAAILTPTPDVVNQMLMGLPLLVLYEVSVVAVWLFGRRSFASFAAAREGEEGSEEAVEQEAAVE